MWKHITRKSFHHASFVDAFHIILACRRGTNLVFLMVTR